MWAIRYKKDRVVELLLGKVDIRPDVVIRDGRTVLSFAAELGSEGAAKLLLERGGVNPDSKDDDGRTPLSFAAEGGHEGVVKLLLERGDVNPNPSDKHGRTPSSYATMMGREGVVKLLSEARTSKFPFPFFLLTLILSIFLFSVFLVYYVYGDSRALFHTINITWQRLIDWRSLDSVFSDLVWTHYLSFHALLFLFLPPFLLRFSRSIILFKTTIQISFHLQASHAKSTFQHHLPPLIERPYPSPPTHLSAFAQLSLVRHPSGSYYI